MKNLVVFFLCLKNIQDLTFFKENIEGIDDLLLSRGWTTGCMAFRIVYPNRGRRSGPKILTLVSQNPALGPKALGLDFADLGQDFPVLTAYLYQDSLNEQIAAFYSTGSYACIFSLFTFKCKDIDENTNVAMS